jgi:hypothetical protein
MLCHFAGPLVVFVVYYFAFRCSRVEFHNLLLGLLTNVFATAAITNFVKLNVRTAADYGACQQKTC